MKKEKLVELLKKLEEGKVSVEETVNELESLPYQDLGFAKIDKHRSLRNKMPEAVLAEGKSSEQILKIVREMEKDELVLVTKVEKETGENLEEEFEKAKFFTDAKMVAVGEPYDDMGKGKILVVSGGTSDLPIAKEAAITAEYLGNDVKTIFDIGVAGIHRLLDHEEEIRNANVIVAVAGMEGSLPSVISGLSPVPVIGVPTSKGYGSNLEGISALLSMLNSCAPGLAVVNIDNGYGAGCMASLINRED